MASDEHRVDFQGTVLHRGQSGVWSVEQVQARPGLLPTFRVVEWDEPGAAGSGQPVWEQQSRPEVRLMDERLSLEDAYCFCDGRAWRMAGVGEAVYRPTGEGTAIDGAAFSADAPADEFRRRALRWVARQHDRGDRRLFFGWRESPATVEASGAEVIDHGRLTVWIFPREPAAPH